MNKYRLAILNVLAVKDLYSFEIMKALKTHPAKKWYWILVSLYNNLHWLEREGYISGYWGDATAERGWNRRRYYELNSIHEWVNKDGKQ